MRNVIDLGTTQGLNAYKYYSKDVEWAKEHGFLKLK